MKCGNCNGSMRAIKVKDSVIGMPTVLNIVRIYRCPKCGMMASISKPIKKPKKKIWSVS